MNKLILLSLVVTVLMVHMKWSFASMMSDNFIRYPSAKFRRDLEMEEFEVTGDKFEAIKRAAARMKRMNIEEDKVRRKRYGLSPEEEDDEEDEDDNRDIRCATETAMNREKRDPCNVEVCTDAIKLGCGSECTSKTRDNIEEAKNMISAWSLCKFEPGCSSDPDITLTCLPDIGNFCPIGCGGDRCNVEPGNSGNCPLKLIIHELLHICGLDHVQKLPGASLKLTINTACIQDGYDSQYTEEICSGDIDSCLIDLPSLMEYKNNGFLKENCVSNIESLYPTMPSACFASRKEPYIPDYRRMAAIYKVTPVFDSDEMGITFEGCGTDIQFAPLVENTALDIGNDMFCNTVEVNVPREQTTIIKCTMSIFKIMYQRWSISGTCPKHNVEISTGYMGSFETISILNGIGDYNDVVNIQGKWISLQSTGGKSADFATIGIQCCYQN